jgi:hypothetical protein
MAARWQARHGRRTTLASIDQGAREMKVQHARSNTSLVSFGVAALLAVGAFTAQVATAGSTGIDATGSYQSEVQACMSGQTQQSRDDCL